MCWTLLTDGLETRPGVLRAPCRQRASLASNDGDLSCSHSHSPITMPAFTSRPLNRSSIHRQLKKRPAFFGIPFLLVMVGASFGLQAFTQTRYDLHSQKVTQVRASSLSCTHFYYSLFLIHFVCHQMSREQELGLDKNRKKFDVREEYFVSPFSPSSLAPRSADKIRHLKRVLLFWLHTFL
jgi:Cytochrome c oxidase assembly protein COX16